MPPPVLYGLGAALAAALAWLVLRTSKPRRPEDDTAAAQTVDGALEPGTTGRLAPSGEDESFKRHPLDFQGGEVGGPYGPSSQEQSPSAPEDGYSEQPGPTQTWTLSPIRPPALTQTQMLTPIRPSSITETSTLTSVARPSSMPAPATQMPARGGGGRSFLAQ